MIMTMENNDKNKTNENVDKSDKNDTIVNTNTSILMIMIII